MLQAKLLAPGKPKNQGGKMGGESGGFVGTGQNKQGGAVTGNAQFRGQASKKIARGDTTAAKETAKRPDQTCCEKGEKKAGQLITS